MSYILNALRKSEQERQAQQAQTVTPNILEANVSENRQSRWPIIIAILVVVNIFTLGYFLMSNTTETPEALSQKTSPEKAAINPAIASNKAAGPAPVIVKEVIKAKSDLAAKTTPRKSIVKTVVKSPSIADLTKPKAPVQSKPQSTSIPQVISKPKTKKSNVKKPLAKKNQVKTAKLDKKTIKPLPAKDITAKPKPVVKTMPKPNAPASNTKKQSQDYPWLKELPYAFRSSLPRLNINVFVYHENPARSFVIVDMNKYQVQESLPGDIKLKEIRKNSMVVSYKNKVFRVRRP